MLIKEGKNDYYERLNVLMCVYILSMYTYIIHVHKSFLRRGICFS